MPLPADTSALSEINGVDRAAVLLLCMGERAAAAVMAQLAPAELLRVAHAMSRAGSVKKHDVHAIVDQFLDACTQHGGANAAPRAYLERSLAAALGEGIASNVLDGIYGDRVRPKLARLQWVSVTRLADVLSREHHRMQALLLAYLPADLAGQLLRALPESQQEALLLATAQLTRVDRELLADLELIADRCLAGLSADNADVPGTRLAAQIIGHVPDDQKRLMEALRAHDATLAECVEANLYSFDILAYQAPEVIDLAVGEVSTETWATALKGTDARMRQVVRERMSRLQEDALAQAMQRLGAVSAARVDAARSEIMAALRTRARDANLFLRLADGEVLE
ncbi:flagellar motor switch protein FliG [Pandoraea cepalis]|uniref:Flagellar motor switch protein FliG n=1 Tax=Pandoraea cepalis TaxID=2508294 RepID=A0AAW7MMI8_9BURK|nr:FliG C-terminal domain-containing protein [Pandoraea cepalis]MDN4573861.1 flagellar motor switch protein FliG [Pandoraea cepalis]MDN4580397.1 flagellar motor switch protein FliG [Pandoraea cepalis]